MRGSQRKLDKAIKFSFTPRGSAVRARHRPPEAPPRAAALCLKSPSPRAPDALGSRRSWSKILMGHATAILRLLALAFLLVLGAASVRAEAMSFQMVTLGVGHCRANCPQVIAASGEIDEGSADNFLR